jgi:hypothetical protein
MQPERAGYPQFYETVDKNTPQGLCAMAQQGPLKLAPAHEPTSEAMGRRVSPMWKKVSSYEVLCYARLVLNEQRGKPPAGARRRTIFVLLETT